MRPWQFITIMSAGAIILSVWACSIALGFELHPAPAPTPTPSWTDVQLPTE